LRKSVQATTASPLKDWQSFYGTHLIHRLLIVSQTCVFEMGCLH